MSIYKLKSKFSALLRPLVNQLAVIGITPNQVTLCALFMSVGMSIFLFYIGPSVWWICLPLVLLVRMALNAVDGMLAREHNMKSDVGFVLNEVCDLISDAAIYLSFIAISGFHSYIIVIFVLLSWLSEVIAMLSFQITKVRANEGPLGKSDRAFLFGVIALLVGLNIDLTFFGQGIMLVANMALILTIYRRLGTIH